MRFPTIPKNFGWEYKFPQLYLKRSLYLIILLQNGFQLQIQDRGRTSPVLLLAILI